eukprot:4813545-Pyramimonas_sp.AAC.1
MSVVSQEERVGLDHLEFCAVLAREQHERGGLFLFEQPAYARSWDQPCVRELADTDGIGWVNTDMCEFKLQVDGGKLNRKPTGILSNSEQ